MPIIALGLMACGCSAMHEDLDDCPEGLYVRFVYDYNTRRADMFKDHVGDLRLYVYDETGVKVAERDVTNTDESAPLQEYGCTVHFADGELADGRYRLQAVAMQRHWDTQGAKPGARYRRNDPGHHTALMVDLDHEATPANGTHHSVDCSAPLDTLWHTLKVQATEPMQSKEQAPILRTQPPYAGVPLQEQLVTVRHGMATYATVSMIRDTKHINVLLRQLDAPQDIYSDDYQVEIYDANAHLDHNNELVGDKKVLYSPYHRWTTTLGADGMEINTGDRPAGAAARTRADGQSVVRRSAHYNLMTNRVMFHANAEDNARMTITRRIDGRKIVDIDLPAVLQEGRMAYDLYNYSAQEYLDREYDYTLHFFLVGDEWQYCDVVIDALGWARRVQKHNLK